MWSTNLRICLPNDKAVKADLLKPWLWAMPIRQRLQEALEEIKAESRNAYMINDINIHHGAFLA